MGVRQIVELIRAGDVDAVTRAVRQEPALLNAHDPDSFGATLLIHAVNCDNRAMAAALLDAGADIDARSDWWAGSFGVLDSGSDAICAWLLERGATLTIHAAARLGMIDRVRDMLDAQPDLVHARGGDGQLPLHFARTPAIAELLLERGAAIDARDIDHASTAAQWQATRQPAVARWLVDRGCEVDPFLAALTGAVDRLPTLIETAPGGVRISIDRTTFPAASPAAGHIYLYTIGERCTLAHAAAMANQPAVVRWLASAGADLNARGGYDDGMPLHQAAWHDSVRAAEALLDAGADRDARSGAIHHNEPVGWAIVSGAVGVVRLLLERGCKLRLAHLDDARAGVRGQFRWIRRERPVEAWREIEALVAEALNRR
jgi:ankyrin repeat protein